MTNKPKCCKKCVIPPPNVAYAFNCSDGGYCHEQRCSKNGIARECWDKNCECHQAPEEQSEWIPTEGEIEAHNFLLRLNITIQDTEKIESFIRQNFISKREVREFIKKKKMTNPDGNANYEQKVYNQALQDLLNFIN